LDRVGKRFGETWAVRGVSLHIRAGEFYTFLGPSGCGKTTLLRIIAGFAFPDEGSVWLDGEVVTALPPWKRDVGMVFQSYAIWPHMTVFENVAFGLRERRERKAEIEKLVGEALRMVNLEGMEGRRPSQLSGGQQQRVALARTLVVQPRVLLLDEPLSNLDARLRAQMRIELLKLQRDLGITTVYVTHDQEEALALSTRIAVMSAGVVIQEGTPREIYESPRERFVAEFVGASNLLAGEVRQAIADAVTVTTELGTQVRVARPSAGAPPSGRILLTIRPEAMDLLPLEEPSDRRNRVEGKVVASAFQGAAIQYEVEVGGTLLRASVTNPKGKRLFQRGDLVAVVFSPEDVGIVPEGTRAESRNWRFKEPQGRD
jgi:spermidine/putrescine ABC transporter ATP-binding subunit